MNQRKFQPGFTLIEILVAITIFSMIVGVVSGSFVSAINLQKRILAYQELFDTTSYIIEYMTRYLRMARKDFEQNCLSNKGYYEEIFYPDYNLNCLRFLDPLKNCSDFCFEDKAIKRVYVDWQSSNNFILTPTTTVEIDYLKFKIQIPTATNSDIQLQPRLTFSFNVKSKGVEQTIKIQTTISPRIFNIKPYD